MAKFSSTSQEKLLTCHPDLQKVFKEVIKTFDCTILVGHRDQQAQDKAFAEGKSKKSWPDSKHNTVPSRAVDVAPFPIDWGRLDRFFLFAGYVLRTAHSMNINLRWGGDWAMNLRTTTNKFEDLVHWEVI